MNILGFDRLEHMYKDDSNFRKAYATCEDAIKKDKSPLVDYMFQK